MPLDDPIISHSSLVPLAMGLAGVMSALSHFGDEITVYKREVSGGLNFIPYFLAKNVIHLLHIAIAPVVFL